MRIAEFVNMTPEQIEPLLKAHSILEDEEGEDAWDYADGSGTARLMEDVLLDAIECIDRSQPWPTILRMAVGKSFRVGCAYGRSVVAPENRA